MCVLDVHDKWIKAVVTAPDSRVDVCVRMCIEWLGVDDK